MAAVRHSNRYIVFSSDDALPPSDPPEIEEDETRNISYKDAGNLDCDELLDRPCQYEPSSDDIPLHSILQRLKDGATSTPRASQNRPRSSSLPTSYPMAIPSSDDILFTPRTERLHNMKIMTQKRLATMQKTKESVQKNKDFLRDTFFANTLDEMEENGYSLADFLLYVFGPRIQHSFDWKWKGFFQQRESVEKIFGYWTTPAYNQSTRTFISSWVTTQAAKVIARESQQISATGMLQKMSRTINEAFFLDYSLKSITENLRKIAPSSFMLLDAFSSTARQKKELTTRSVERQELVRMPPTSKSQCYSQVMKIRGSAILALLRSKSQNNNYVQAVHGTYLLATGAQRQHFSIFTALGISTSYTNIISRPAGNPSSNKSSITSTAKKVRKRSPGTLYLLSQACRDTARKIAASHMFVTVYDNINMMTQVAEQIAGRKSRQRVLSLSVHITDVFCIQTPRRMGHAPQLHHYTMRP